MIKTLPEDNKPELLILAEAFRDRELPHYVEGSEWAKGYHQGVSDLIAFLTDSTPEDLEELTLPDNLYDEK